MVGKHLPFCLPACPPARLVWPPESHSARAAAALPALTATQTIRVPEVFHHGDLPSASPGSSSGSGSFIVMEHLELRGSCDQGWLISAAVPCSPQIQALSIDSGAC